jgi:hypothetical protein
MTSRVFVLPSLAVVTCQINTIFGFVTFKISDNSHIQSKMVDTGWRFCGLYVLRTNSVFHTNVLTNGVKCVSHKKNVL